MLILPLTEVFYLSIIPITLKMSIKSLITTTYGSGTYKRTTTFQEVHCKAVTAKNQLTFLNRCIYHKIIPRFLQIKPPLLSQRVKNVTDEHKRTLLIATRNDTKTRYYKRVNESKELTKKLKDELSEEHFDLIQRITLSSREKKFNEIKTKFKNKFEILYMNKYKKHFTTTFQQNSTVIKNCVLDLAGNIPEKQLATLNLGPKFAVTPKPFHTWTLLPLLKSKLLI